MHDKLKAVSTCEPLCFDDFMEHNAFGLERWYTKELCKTP